MAVSSYENDHDDELIYDESGFVIGAIPKAITLRQDQAAVQMKESIASCERGAGANAIPARGAAA